MGEIAEMMIDGTMCQHCGEWMHEGEDGPGYPQSCCVDDGLTPKGDGSGKTRRNKRKRQRVARKRRARLADEVVENASLWLLLSEHHWRRIIKDENLDYWPSTGVFSYKGKIHKGEDVYKFIEKEEKQCPK